MRTNELTGPYSRSVFTYDGLGRLRQREEYAFSGTPTFYWYLTETVRYIYDGMRVIQERNDSNTPTVGYTRGRDLSGSLEGAGGIGGLLSRSSSYSSGTGNWSVHNHYHADGNGNVTYMVNSSQTVAASYRYDPYGNTISSSGGLASANVYRFSSKEIHVNSGLYYYGYRWYHPNLQRWLNRDPLGEPGFEVSRRGRINLLGDGPNLYFFVYNDPLSRYDPFGLDIDDCLAECDKAKSNAGVKEVGRIVKKTWYIHAALAVGTVAALVCKNAPAIVVVGLADVADIWILTNAGENANKKAATDWATCCTKCGVTWNDPEAAQRHIEGKP